MQDTAAIFEEMLGEADALIRLHDVLIARALNLISCNFQGLSVG
jgi:hypothetical protein